MAIPNDAQIVLRHLHTKELYFYHVSKRYFEGIRDTSMCCVSGVKGGRFQFLRVVLEFVESISDYKERLADARATHKVSKGVQQVQDIDGTGNETDAGVPASSEGGQEDCEGEVFGADGE